MAEVEYLEDDIPAAEAAASRERGGLTITGVIRTLREYAALILAAVLAAGAAYLIGAVVYILMQPLQRNTILGFRLEFPGADVGTYPSGVKFSGSDIVDTNVLRTTFDANGLQRYMTFSDFSRSVVVLESNATLEQLGREYEAKLANPKLSAVERERLEAEYNQKRESLRKNEFSLVLATREGLTRLPRSVAAKTLSDILQNWADFAAKTRQVLSHRVPLVSDQALSRLGAKDPNLFGSLMALRSTALELQTNIDALSRLPGAEVIRSTKRSASLRELELELSQVQRSNIEYLITQVLRSGTIDRSRAAATIESQLAFDRRALQAAEERVSVIRRAFDDYSNETRQSAAAVSETAKDLMEAAETPAAVIPQVSDTFLERLIALAQDAADRSYRQRQVEEIKTAALEALPLRSTVAYEQQLLADLRSGSATIGMDMAQVTADRDAIASRLATIAADLIDIRRVLSRSLTTNGQMYTVTAPATMVTERSVSMSRIGLLGILVVTVAALLAIAVAFVHHRMRLESGRAV